MSYTCIKRALRSADDKLITFLAPMAGITHSAFRRLIADFGGYEALFTEMLWGKALLHENMLTSPATKRRECEGQVFYQLLLDGSEDIAAVIQRLGDVKPKAIDLNLGCPAPKIYKSGAGISLFNDLDRLASVLETIRSSWPGILTVKCRLGSDARTWKEAFQRRLRIFERFAVDAIHVHARFFCEKLKRTARHYVYPWIVSHTSIPIIANGDILPEILAGENDFYQSGVTGIMVGRMAVVKPWVFLECAGRKPDIDYAEVWARFYTYVREDFTPERAIGKIKEFSIYYARNFFYGHLFFKAVQNALTLNQAYESAMRFLSAKPQVVAQPLVAGI